MKVAHLIFSFRTGGAETMLIDIINEQIKEEEICLIIINDNYDKSLIEQLDRKVKIFKINRPPGSKNPFFLLKLNSFLFWLAPKAIHCHDHICIETLLPIFWKKCLLTVHDVGVDSRNFRKYRLLFAISNIVKKDIENRSGIKAKIVYNGIKLEKIRRKGTIVSNKGDFKIVVVSRLRHEKKGQDILIAAIEIIASIGHTKVSLDIIGSGPSEQYLKSLCANLKIEDRVRFLGVMERQYIYKNLMNYDLLVQPSRYEGFGLTVIEAMAAKIPVLVSNIDGPLELIHKGKYGFYFINEDEDDLADKILEIKEKSHKGRLVPLVNRAFNYVAKNYRISNTANQYIREYKGI